MKGSRCGNVLADVGRKFAHGVGGSISLKPRSTGASAHATCKLPPDIREHISTQVLIKSPTHGVDSFSPEPSRLFARLTDARGCGSGAFSHLEPFGCPESRAIRVMHKTASLTSDGRHLFSASIQLAPVVV